MTTETTHGATPTLLAPEQWTARRADHEQRVGDLVGPYLRRRRAGAEHQVIDFLFTYYSSRPAHLERWHPGFGVVLVEDRQHAADELLATRGYHRSTEGVTASSEFLDSRIRALRQTVNLLSATAARPPRMGCFGLHEWAMVYRTDRPRHSLPLRLGAAGTDAVVESMPLRCTHFDAFRFFTDPARGRNERSLTRADQLDVEQPGCLHATMDLYRACFTLAPLLPAELTADAFELALRARELDMRASPYDVTGLGYSPVPIETPAGRAAYAREQTTIAHAGALLRDRIVSRCAELIDRKTG
ncbi:hypothetical protein [Gordonia soli]|uniref:3-methyladenine DNA glycosylase n=1 Tax=Gordonia soli NBRC 108243 TaxID=1223545 RepID=M0QLY6_9ACTN|nr:hypothetical protein [Gordonia soli]GAC69685.1 hypothetical protein GS4_26_01330 [Gordonia soli NBRC 108243]